MRRLEFNSVHLTVKSDSKIDDNNLKNIELDGYSHLISFPFIFNYI